MAEECKGCGAVSPAHPVVMIHRENDDDRNSPMIKSPICKTCHEDPTNRKVQLKGHFHYRADGARGLAMARVLDDMSKNGEDLGIGG